MPTEAICFRFKKFTNDEALSIQLVELYKFIVWLCDRDIPHNLFLTPDRSEGQETTLKVFVFARKRFCYVKDLSTFNIGFCELSGYVTVGDEHLFESLTEQQVLSKIQDETGNVYEEIYKYFT